MGDDDVFVLESIANAQKSDEERLRVTLVLSLRDTMESLTRILKTVEVREATHTDHVLYKCFWYCI